MVIFGKKILINNRFTIYVHYYFNFITATTMNSYKPSPPTARSFWRNYVVSEDFKNILLLYFEQVQQYKHLDTYKVLGSSIL